MATCMYAQGTTSHLHTGALPVWGSGQVQHWIQFKITVLILQLVIELIHGYKSHTHILCKCTRYSTLRTSALPVWRPGQDQHRFQLKITVLILQLVIGLIHGYNHTHTHVLCDCIMHKILATLVYWCSACMRGQVQHGIKCKIAVLILQLVIGS